MRREVDLKFKKKEKKKRMSFRVNTGKEWKGFIQGIVVAFGRISNSVQSILS